MNEDPRKGELTIRQAVSTDILALSRLDHGYSTEYVWQLSKESAPAEVGVTFREIRLPRPMRVAYPRDPARLADEWTSFEGLLVAELGDQLVAYLGMIDGPAPDSSWITDVVVGQRQRRQGIASRLLLAAQGWNRHRGLAKVFVEMQSKNVPMVKLVSKLGFVFAGYSDTYYLDQEITLFFSIDLR